MGGKCLTMFGQTCTHVLVVEAGLYLIDTVSVLFVVSFMFIVSL